MEHAWMNIHDGTLAELRRRYQLLPVGLKHPFPERPWRLAGLLKFDGDVYCTGRLVRALFLRTSFLGTASRSLLLCPRMEFNFPVFTNETIVMGRRVLFLVDVQQVFPAAERFCERLFDDVQAIRSGYADLLAEPAAVRGEIARGFSPAAVYVKLSPDRYGRAAELLQHYLRRYLDALDAVQPPADAQLPGARQAFDDYADLVIEHDPAMRFLKRMFGAVGARERAYDMFFGK
ncbi:MAG: hypothetical protein FJ119_02860 [Deltaproteobacteria bacterium]|nr:hypothetical protein [Deltaproteobacteria bacterium]